MTIPRTDRRTDCLIGERYVAQLLAGRPATDALTAVERLLAVQAQDPRGARLAIRARTSGVSSADVDARLEVDDRDDIHQIFALADEANYSGGDLQAADFEHWTQLVRWQFTVEEST